MESSDNKEKIINLQEVVKQKILEEQSQHCILNESNHNLSSKDIIGSLNSNEDGDARLFTHLNRGKFCYDHTERKWYRWCENYWEEDRLNNVFSAFDDVIDVYSHEAEQQSVKRLQATKNGEDSKAKKAQGFVDQLLKRIETLQTVRRRKNVLILAAAGDMSLGIKGDEWDEDPCLLGCKNGVVDLKTGGFRQGNPDDFIKTIAPTEWTGLETSAPQWERFLYEIFDGDEELVRYNQRLFGYGISGLMIEHIVIILWGAGRNGKGTLFEVLQIILGDYIKPVQSEMLLRRVIPRDSSSHSSDLMSLMGKRMVWASESDRDRQLDISKVKWLSGGDTITGRFAHGKREISFQPTHKIFFMTNHRPRIPADEFAAWERISLVPFTVSFVDDVKRENDREPDKHLKEKLLQEKSGILAWLVRGFLEWQKEGLNPPEIVKEATEQYQQDEDFIGQFLQESCVIDPNEKEQAGPFYQAYLSWCKMNVQTPLGQRKFGEDIKERFTRVEISGKRFYKGVKVISLIS